MSKGFFVVGDQFVEIERLVGEASDAVRARGVAESQLTAARQAVAVTATQMEDLRVRRIPYDPGL